MGHKRVLLLAHGKKAETPEFKEAYAWLEKDGHHIDLMKTGSPDDMSKGVKKLIAHFDGKQLKFALTASCDIISILIGLERSAAAFATSVLTQHESCSHRKYRLLLGYNDFHTTVASSAVQP